MVGRWLRSRWCAGRSSPVQSSPSPLEGVAVRFTRRGGCRLAPEKHAPGTRCRRPGPVDRSWGQKAAPSARSDVPEVNMTVQAHVQERLSRTGVSSRMCSHQLGRSDACPTTNLECACVLTLRWLCDCFTICFGDWKRPCDVAVDQIDNFLPDWQSCNPGCCLVWLPRLREPGADCQFHQIENAVGPSQASTAVT